MVKWTNRMHQVAYFELKVTMHGLPSHVLLSLGYKSFQDYLLTLPKFTGSAVQKKFIHRLCSSSIVTGIRLAGTLLCIMCYICCFVWADRSHSPAEMDHHIRDRTALLGGLHGEISTWDRGEIG